MDDRIEVTEENFGELLVQGLKEALAIEKGDIQTARVRRRKVSARLARVAPPPKYSAARIA